MSGKDMLFNMDVLKQLTHTQRIIFLRALAKMSSVDGNFDAQEKEFIYNTGSILGLSATEIEDIFAHLDYDTVLRDAAQLNNRHAALELLKELCLLAHTDNELSDQEVLFLGQIGEAMGIELQKIEDISSWVINYIVWRDQEKIIFEKF